MTGATSGSSASGSPMSNSSPSGWATSSRKKVPSERPETRRTNSPTVQPNVIMWYPLRVPGSHHGCWRARRSHMCSQSYMAPGSSSPDRAGTPAEWSSIIETTTPSLPFVANSGQYVATGASRSSSPRSARCERTGPWPPWCTSTRRPGCRRPRAGRRRDRRRLPTGRRRFRRRPAHTPQHPLRRAR